MAITKEFVAQLGEYLIVSANNRNASGMDAGTIMAQDQLNKYVRDILRSAGFTPSDKFNPVFFRRDVDPDLQTSSYGQFVHEDCRIDIFGHNLPTNPVQALLVTAHETMHMIQRFVLNYGYDKEIESGFTANDGKSSKDALDQAAFESAQQTFFSYEVTAGCDYRKFKSFLQNDLFFDKDIIPIIRDDMAYYSSLHGYTSNFVEIQANAFASQYVCENVEMTGMHALDKLAVARYMDELQREFLKNIYQNQDPNIKKKRLKEVRSNREEKKGIIGRLRDFFVHNKADKEFLTKKDIQAAETVCRQTSRIVQGLQQQVSDIQTKEDFDRQQLEKEQDEKAAEQIMEAVKEHGLNLLPQIDAKNIKNAIAREYDSKKSLLATVSTLAYIDPIQRENIYIDLDNNLLVIDGGRAIRDIIERQERAQEIVDRALDQESKEQCDVVKDADVQSLDDAR